MIILTVLAVFLFGGLLVEAIKLSIKVAWGIAKVIAGILCIVALPLLIIVIVSAGGLLLFLPILLVAGACGILKSST